MDIKTKRLGSGAYAIFFNGKMIGRAVQFKGKFLVLFDYIFWYKGEPSIQRGGGSTKECVMRLKEVPDFVSGVLQKLQHDVPNFVARSLFSEITLDSATGLIHNQNVTLAPVRPYKERSKLEDDEMVAMYHSGLLPQEIADKQSSTLWTIIDRLILLGEAEPVPDNHPIHQLIAQKQPVVLHQNSREFPALLELIRSSPYSFERKTMSWIHNSKL